MSIEIWLTFVLTATIILFIPGPTIIYIVGQSLTHGRKASMPLSIGVLSADAICITLSLIGLSTILSLFSAAFITVKYFGAAYLVYLGLKMIFENGHLRSHESKTNCYNSRVLFRDVFLVNALNPKGIIFYSAFMPQFVTAEHNLLLQLAVLAATFLCLALLNVVCVTLLASRASELFKSLSFVKAFNVTGGLGLICAGIYSTTLERR